MNKINTAQDKTVPYKKQRSGALHLTKKVEYAIMLLTILARSESKESLSIKSISEDKGLSFAFMQKVARMLQTEGLITAERGKYGGYTLTIPAKKLSVKKIIEVMEGEIAIVPCLCSKTGACAKSKNCDVKIGLKRINDDLIKYFGEQTLHQIIS